MAPRGRPPKPIERKKATMRDANHTANGTAIARLEVTPDRSVPAVPASITGRGEVEWAKVWVAGHWLKRDQDYHWVEMIAQAYADIEVFRARVQEDGLIATGYAGQVVAHPLIAEIRRAEKLIQECLSKLGFSPTDRARLAITELKQESLIEDLLSRARDR